jgi:hypothetical protein
MLDALVLRLARTTAAGMDVPAVLADVCSTAQAVLGVRGVVVAVARRGEVGLGPLAGSDDVAAWIGRLQCGPRGEPLTGVARFGRAVLTTDLARVGSPELAAAAAATGLTGLMTVPLVAGGVSVGALQLLGNAANPVGPARVEPLAGVLEVLAARLADVDELRRVSAPCAGPDHGEQRDQVDTAVFAAVRPGPTPRGAGGVDLPTVRMGLPEPPDRPQAAEPGPARPVGPAPVGPSPLVRLLGERRGGLLAPPGAAAPGSGWDAPTGRLGVVEDGTTRMAAVTAAAPPAPSDEQPVGPAEDAVDPTEGAPEPGPGAGGGASPTPDEGVDPDAPDECVTEPAPLGEVGGRDGAEEPTPPASEQPEPPVTRGLPEILVPVPRRREPGARRPSPVARQVCHPTPPGQRRG